MTTQAHPSPGVASPHTTGRVRRTSEWSMEDEPPTVELSLPPGREYSGILHQTKIVYDQLLADKHSKLKDAILQQKSEFDARCEQIVRKSGAKNAQAIEYGVRAQEALNKLQKQSTMEVEALKEDYQEKLLTMQHQMEAAWRAKH